MYKTFQNGYNLSKQVKKPMQTSQNRLTTDANLIKKLCKPVKIVYNYYKTGIKRVKIQQK